MEKCKAKSKRSGERCGNYPLKGKVVCKFHGGRGGAKTPEGKQRRATANLKHGFYSKESIEQRRQLSRELKAHKEAIGE